MKKMIKITLIVLAIFNLTFCKNEEKLNVNEILGILLLKKNSESVGESLGLKIAFSYRLRKSNGEIFSCKEYPTAYLDKKAEWDQGLKEFVVYIKAGIGLDLVADRVDGPCVVPNKVSACIYEGEGGVNFQIPHTYSYSGEREYLVPTMHLYNLPVKTAKEACLDSRINRGLTAEYRCYAQGQCWE
ncbi:lipoprotein [Leptospira mayottensis]|uniref:LIC_11695 family lipoprotein n=1 Tax=Leptospira mayottensis TaxID=1137606 RepID=UPI001082F096|nr:LIC_11695 family lipoprotein [Leptospira mayottensis]TGM89587.1 lipoprotein [Leptospira mayottensis]